MAVLMVITALAGCLNNSEGDFEPPEFVFNGTSTVQDAVRVIQNRASIYVAEQS